MNSLNKNSNCPRNTDHYHSVELSIEGLDIPHQFKIWENATELMNVLINKDSSVLPLLKVGDTLATKYYSSDSVYPSQKMMAIIEHITQNRNGRLKGHYLVGLKIIDS